jgi:hypothetical protein
MHSLLITLATVVAVALVHFSYVDFRFRYRDGILWFWLLKPAPPLMWAARGTVVLALLMALLIPIVGATRTYAYAIVAVMVLHIVSLILLEVLEPR